MSDLRNDARMALARYESSFAAFGAEASFDIKDVHTVREYINETETELLECKDEIDRLTKKCNKQAMVLRRLTPEQHPDTLFISGVLGSRDQNNMPEKLLVVPAYGVDFSYIYERTEKTTGTEW